MLIELLIQQLADNIRQDLDLLKGYEDELRYETDPRRLARYRREIERQRESLSRYQQEYDELCGQGVGVPTGMQDTADMLHQMDAKLDCLMRSFNFQGAGRKKLHQMDAKLDGILSGQKVIQDDLKDFRKTLLAHFDASEKAIISTIVERLDQNQLATVQSIIDGMEGNHVPESELQETLNAVQQSISEINQNEAGFYDSKMVRDIKSLADVVDDPRLDVSHKLKVSLPIIPLILSYEGEVGIKSGVNLKAAWEGLTARVRGKV
ncbi:MAG: hypothetical protein C5S40_05660 [ANME-2 cluster archaeon]|nr:hypothetical protein [ANME-2 cluster archaeon]